MKRPVSYLIFIGLCLFVSFSAAKAEPEPVAWWKLDETSGIIAADFIGDANGILMNGPIWTDGIIDGGLSFDGIDDYLEIPGYKGIPGGASRTCMAWIKTIQPTDEIISWGEDYTGGRWVIRVNEGGQLRAEVQGGNIIGTTVINDGSWHHIAVVLEDDGSPDVNEAKLYVDGNLETISSSADEPIHTGSYQNVQIGMYYTGERYFEGLIDDVRIYDQVLSESEINDAIFWRLLNPIFHLPLNETSGVIAPDIAGGHDGTLVNMDDSDWTAGIEGYALDFDGADDYIEADDYKGISGSSSRSCMAWIKTDSVNKEILSWGSIDIGEKWLVLIDTNGHLRVSISGGGIAGSSPLSDGQWHHIAVVLADDGSADISEAILYVDGQREGLSSFEAGTINTGEIQNVQIGLCEIQGYNRFFKGLIDDVRIYSEALIPKEIKDLVSEFIPIKVWVDDDYTDSGFNDGHIWGVNAFDKIQDGINVGEYGYVVSVANGTYNETITLKCGVSVIGADTDRCIIRANNNDLSVVTAEDCDQYTVLQGFTITNIDNGRGGMYNKNSNLIITNCIFTGNSSYRNGGGAGMYNEHSSPTVTDCQFIENSALEGSGGGMSNAENSNPIVTNCTFIANSAYDGGGMHNGIGSSPTITNCIFSENMAYSHNYYRGGGMYNDTDSSPTVTNCIFSGNIAGNGGGMYNGIGCSPTVANCIFNKNKAYEYGGGMHNNQSSLAIANCILWADTASISGNEVYNQTNLPIIRYSDIAGCGGSGAGWDSSLGADGGGNIDTDPLFAGGGDFHLQSRAGRINLTLDGPLWITDTYTSPCIDAGDPADNAGYEPAGNGGRINMGAYGGTNQASKSSNIAGDIDGNGFVNLIDFIMLAENWLAGTPPTE